LKNGTQIYTDATDLPREILQNRNSPDTIPEKY